MERSHITCKMAAEVAADAAVDAAAKTQTAHLAQAQARNLLSSRPLSLLSVVQRENTACSSIFKMNAHQPSRCRDLVKFNRTIPVLYQKTKCNPTSKLEITFLTASTVCSGYTRLHPSFQHEHVVRTFAWTTVRGGRQRNVHACARARTHTPPLRPAPAASIPYPITFLDHVTIATWEITIANKRWARRCRLDEA